MASKANKAFTIRVTSDFYNAFKKQAELERRSVANLLKRIAEQYLIRIGCIQKQNTKTNEIQREITN